MKPAGQKRFLDEAERALQGAFGGRRQSETSFLQQLMRELGAGVSAVRLSPADLFRAALANRPLVQGVRDVLEILAVPSQQLKAAVRAGDWMVRAVPGTGDVGHVSVLASDDLLSQSMLASEGIAAESAQPGYYGLVIEAGAFPHSRSRPFARRMLDSQARVPPNTVFLRPGVFEVGAEIATPETALPFSQGGREDIEASPVTIVPPALPSPPEAIDPKSPDLRIDPADPRIDVVAKFALQRMIKRPDMAVDAARLIRGINGETLAGIFGENLRAAVKVAEKLGTVRWKLVPKGEDAALILDPEAPTVEPPTIIFRVKEEKPPGTKVWPLPRERMDPALQKASRTFELWQRGELGPCAGSPSAIPVPNLVPSLFCHSVQVPPFIPPTITLARWQRQTMSIGFNYPIPWNAYGYYFGGGYPPGSDPNLDQWTANLRRNLSVLRDEFDIRIVRIFLLCNALNYGEVVGGGRTFIPPGHLHKKFTEHLTVMLEGFSQAEMFVIPSLIDFKAFGRRIVLGKDSQGNPITNGCTEKHHIVREDHIRDFFFSQVLEHFLVKSKPYKGVIHAWELQNEPVWNTYYGALIPQKYLNPIAGGKTVEVPKMTEFLRKGLELIKQHGFRSTVGHRFSDDLANFPTGSERQIHYYPVRVQLKGTKGITVKDKKVPDFATTQAFIGEFGITGKDSNGKYPHGHPWPELKGADDKDTRSRVLERLRLLQDRGYRLALVWPDEPGIDLSGKDVEVGGRDPIKLSKGARQGILDFQKQKIIV